MEVGGHALIDHMLDRLAQAGVTRAVVNVHAFADRLEAHLGRRAAAPAIVVSDERAEPLETGGGIRRAAVLLGEAPVFTANIDAVWIERGEPALPMLGRGFDPERMDARLLLTPTDAAMGFDGPGDFFMDGEGRLAYRGTAGAAPYAYAGVQVFKPGLAAAESDTAFSTLRIWKRLAVQGRLFGAGAGRDLDARRRSGRARRGGAAAGGAMTRPSPALHALFGGPAPRWFTVAAHRPFLDDLAFALDAAFAAAGPEALAEAVVFTPTRRAARALAQAFVGAAGGRAVLLPQIRALGDLDEGEPPFEPGELALDLPPAITPLRRRFELARLVAANERLFDRRLDAAAALELADAWPPSWTPCRSRRWRTPSGWRPWSRATWRATGAAPPTCWRSPPAPGPGGCRSWGCWTWPPAASPCCAP